MNLSRRHILLLGTLALKPAAAQDSTGPRRLLLDASRALQGGNAARFIGYFDKQHYTERPTLRRTIAALMEARTVASSIDILSLLENDGGWQAKIDWLLQLSPIAGAGAIETRQQTVTAELAEDKKGRWRITGFDSGDLFRVL